MIFLPATDDEITLSVYSDLFKDRHGFRPRFPITVQEAQMYIDSCSDSDIDWEEEERIDDYIKRMEAEERASIAAIERDLADFQMEAWQIQAARLSNIKEQWILDY